MKIRFLNRCRFMRHYFVFWTMFKPDQAVTGGLWNGLVYVLGSGTAQSLMFQTPITDRVVSNHWARWSFFMSQKLPKTYYPCISKDLKSLISISRKWALRDHQIGYFSLEPNYPHRGPTEQNGKYRMKLIGPISRDGTRNGPAKDQLEVGLWWGRILFCDLGAWAWLGFVFELGQFGDT